MSDKKYTLYSSTTCSRCPLARGSIERAGAEYEEVKLDLPEHGHKIEDLKLELDLKPGQQLAIPVVRTPDGRLLTNLATISAEFSAAGQANWEKANA